MLLALAVCSAHHARAAWVIDGRLAPLVSAVVSPRNLPAPCRQRSRGILLMNDNAEDEDDGAIDMAALAARIEEVSNAPGPEDVRLLVLDSMVPGQKLTCFTEILTRTLSTLIHQCIGPDAEGVHVFESVVAGWTRSQRLWSTC